MRVLILFLTIIITNLSYSALRLKIIEPIRFGEVDIKAVGDSVVGQGAIEIFSDDLENDKDKKFIFRFPKKGLMTNKKRGINKLSLFFFDLSFTNYFFNSNFICTKARKGTPFREAGCHPRTALS